VLRRCPAPMMALTAALALGLVLLPSPSRADGLTASSNTSNTPTVTLDYSLTTTQAIAPTPGDPSSQSGTPTPQVLATDTPISIVPPPSSSATGPLQLLGPSDGYYYKNPGELLVGVGNTTLNGSPVQALGLTFFGQGLAAGDSLTFSLSFDKSIVNGNPPVVPQFTVVDPTTLQPISSIQIKYIGVDSSSSGTSTGTTSGSGNGTGTTVAVQNAPEPVSLLLWSALAGVGMWRTRRRVAYGRRGLS
jgi:hypothetical protein